MEVTYKKSDFKALIAESSNEFKAKLGVDVEKKDKEINGKAYSDAKKRAKNFDGGLQKKEEDWARGDAKYEKNDYNGTTLDHQPENADDDYKKRVKAQVDGYNSEEEKNNKIEKAGDFSDNENIRKGIEKSGKEMHDEKEDDAKKGLTGSKRSEGYFKREDLYTESKGGEDMRNMLNMLAERTTKETNRKQPIDVAHYKKTVFLSETHMRSIIPDDFKTEGKVFKMKDANGNEYLMEWKYNNAVILEHSNKKGADESLTRMKQLCEYKSQDTKTNNAARLIENDQKFAETLNKMRKLMK